MSKKVISVFLVISLLFSLSVTAFAKEDKSSAPDKYYEAEVELRDNTNGIQSVEQTFMIPGDESGLYVKAESISELLSLYDFFFDFEMTYTQCALASDELDYAVMFKLNSNEVKVYAAGYLVEYTSPLPIIYQDGIAWLPFEFTMRMFNCSYDVDWEGLYVQPPRLSALMAISSLYGSGNYAFDFVNEYGLSKFSSFVMDDSAALINALSGVIGFEGHAWADLVTLNMANATEKHYAQNIAEMFVAPSSNEIDSTDDSVPLLFIEAVGDFASDSNTLVEITDSGFEYSKLEKMIKTVMDSNINFKYDNRVFAFYEAFKNNKKSIEKISDYVTKAAKTSGKILDNLDVAATLLSSALEIANFYLSIVNKNEFATEALKTYCSETEAVAHKTMQTYANTSEDDVGAVVMQFLANNVLDIIGSNLPLPSLIGAPATIVLIGWNLLSSYVPYFSNGLESADTYELTECAINYQNDAKEIMQEYRNKVFTGDSINEQQFEILSKHAYAHLKFSVIARNGASVVLKNATKITDATKKSKQNQFDMKNNEIGRLLTALETPDNVYFPSDVSKSQKNWIKDKLFDAMRSFGKEVDEIDQKYKPIDELEFLITPEEAIKMVQNRMAGPFAELIFDSIFSEFLSFKVMEEAIRVDEKNKYAYIVNYLVDGTPDYYCFFVPIDGSEMWMGWLNSDGSYYCYSDVDLKNFKLSDLIDSITKMYKESLNESY